MLATRDTPSSNKRGTLQLKLTFTAMLLSLLLSTLLSTLGIGSPISPGGPEADLITDLPGLSYKPAFKQYSGYLDATEGRKLHYWFVESESNPSKDPLVLWMNGGPGCSSLAGLLSEQGPFWVNKKNYTQLVINQSRWNRIANVIFLEAPAGVGFSYRVNSNNYTTDDDQTARDNHAAIKSFFQKFPEYKKNDFYITGESYGGIYVPTLATQILRNSPDINFKGWAIGNGYLDKQMLGDSIVYFLYSHGLFGDTLFTQLITNCCDKTGAKCNFASNPNPKCRDLMVKVANIAWSSGNNPYNLYQDCEYPEKMSGREMAARNLMMETFENLKEKLELSIMSSPPCMDESHLENYLNQPSVRKALHIPDSVQEWTICTQLPYHWTYNTVRPLIQELLKEGKKGLIYNGDVDMACNFLGDQWFSDSLGLKVLSDYQAWHLGKQVAGYVKKYENLTFATVKGSGHMVPTDKPAAALALFHGLISD